MNFIKGSYIKEIYSNKDNGYVVGVLKVKETDLELAIDALKNDVDEFIRTIKNAISRTNRWHIYTWSVYGNDVSKWA